MSMHLKKVSALWTALPMCLVLAAAADAVVYQVPGDYNTIQDAVDAAAASGDRIEVSSVLSQEDVQVVDKDIEIVAMASPIVVGSFSWTNPGGQASPAGGLVDGFHVTGDVTTTDLEGSFVANGLSVDGRIDVSAPNSEIPDSYSITHCLAQTGIRLDGPMDVDGGGVLVLDCQTPASIHANGASPIVQDCVLTGTGDITCIGTPGARVATCTVNEGFIFADGRDGEASAVGNVIVSGNLRVESFGTTTAVENALFGGGIRNEGSRFFYCQRNRCFLGDVGISASGAEDFSEIEGNLVVRCGLGINGDYQTSIKSNTVVECTEEGIRSQSDTDQIEQNIVVGCGIGIQLVDAQHAACNDVWGNTQNWVGAPDQEGINGNFSVDPLFCDPDLDDFTLASTSACLPGNHPDGNDCGTVGAFVEGCSGPVPVIDASWGGVKSRFRR